MGRAMISIKNSKNWQQDKVKTLKTYTWDIKEAERRIWNNLPLYDDNIVEDKKNKKVI